jgi:hypothetical protein
MGTIAECQALVSAANASKGDGASGTGG